MRRTSDGAGDPNGDRLEKMGGSDQKILIVDSDEGLRTVLCRLLLSKGYQVVTAASAAEAMAACKRRGPFHLLLTEVRLPGITGLELAHWVQRVLPDAAVVAMSAHPRGLVEQSTYWCVRHSFVEKPFKCESLLELVAMALPGPD